MRREKGDLKKYYVASVSFGKDSTWMLLMILGDLEKYPLDHVVFVNTGMEFDAVYKVRNAIVDILISRGIEYTEILIAEQFKHAMFSREVCKRGTKEVHRIGYGWCGGACRWGTALKLSALQQFYRRELSNYKVVEYVGIAADESHRVDKDAEKRGDKVYPLVKEGFSEASCLQFCYSLGYTWKENGYYLYEKLKRLSCWCCRNKNLSELKAIYYFFPKYWEQLYQYEKIIGEPFKKGEGGSLWDLEARFQKEGYAMSIYDLWNYPEELQVQYCGEECK